MYGEIGEYVSSIERPYLNIFGIEKNMKNY